MVSFFLLFKPDLFALFLPNTPQPCIRSYRFVYIKSIANHFSGIQCSEHWSKGVLSLTSTVLKGKTLWEKNLPMNFVVCCCKRKTNFLNLPSLFPQVWKWWRQLVDTTLNFNYFVSGPPTLFQTFFTDSLNLGFYFTSFTVLGRYFKNSPSNVWDLLEFPEIKNCAIFWKIAINCLV